MSTKGEVGQRVGTRSTTLPERGLPGRRTLELNFDGQSVPRVFFNSGLDPNCVRTNSLGGVKEGRISKGTRKRDRKANGNISSPIQEKTSGSLANRTW